MFCVNRDVVDDNEIGRNWLLGQKNLRQDIETPKNTRVARIKT